MVRKVLLGEVLHAVPETAQESQLEALKATSGTVLLRPYIFSPDDHFAALTSFQRPCKWPSGPKRILVFQVAQQAPCLWQAVPPAGTQDSATRIFMDLWTVVSPVEHC